MDRHLHRDQRRKSDDEIVRHDHWWQASWRLGNKRAMLSLTNPRLDIETNRDESIEPNWLLSVGNDSSVTTRAGIRNPSIRLRLKVSLLALFVAICTKPMRWLRSAHRWLQHVSQRTPANCLKLITLLLSIPVFKIANFLFQAAYRFNLRRMIILGLDSRALGLHDLPLHIHYNGTHSAIVGQLQHLLRKTEDCAKRLGCDDDKDRFEAKLGKLAKAKPKAAKK